jgi:hypothetical protein
MAAFVGLTYFTGVIEGVDTVGNSIPVYYSGNGLYVSANIVSKFTYDIGVGIEVFGQVSAPQSIAGLRLFMFFSSAYRGPKRNYNPNVRSENPR